MAIDEVLPGGTGSGIVMDAGSLDTRTVTGCGRVVDREEAAARADEAGLDGAERGQGQVVRRKRPTCCRVTEALSVGQSSWFLVLPDFQCRSRSDLCQRLPVRECPRRGRWDAARCQTETLAELLRGKRLV